MTGQWAWVDNAPQSQSKSLDNLSKSYPINKGGDGTYMSGKWSYMFLAPGDYNFRISRCACKTCVPLADDILVCPNYPTISASATITVSPMFEGLESLTPDEQIVVGAFWWILVSYNVANASGVIQDIVDAVTVARKTGSATCSSCICDIQSLIQDLETAANDFNTLYYSFSQATLNECFGAIVNVLVAIVPTLTACDVNALTGNNVIAILEDVINDLVADLSTVEEVIDIAIEGTTIYIETVNFMTSLNAGQYFAAGVYYGRFLETVSSIIA